MTLPDLSTADLDAGTLALLFDDLERHAEVLDVYIKGGATQYTPGQPVPLRSAQTLLASGEVRGVQIRYLWDGVEWRDTLLRAAAGIRVIRIKVVL